jgi:Cyclin, N-terminal domain/Cyclin, C-terminal domain
MSVATMNPTAVPLPHQHLGHTHSGCQTSTSGTTHIHSPPHPHAHGFHRRRLASPISPLSMTHNTRSLNKLNDEITAACDREVQWSFEVEYGRMIEKHMKESEVKYFRVVTYKQERAMPSAEMMGLQPELDWHMLPYLVDFIIEVHFQFRMSPYTLHLAINLINRYVSKRVVFKKHYQLVGCAALWIAAKFEDAKDKVPTVRELRNMCVGAYEEDMFVQMEGHVLTTLGWELGGVQTCEAFMEHQITRLRGRHGHVDGRLVHLSRFFLDLSLFGREFLSYKPSEIAAASVALSRHILGSQQFLQEQYTEREVDCVELLLMKIPSASDILRHKYSNKRLLNVTSLIDDFIAQAARNDFEYITPPSSQIQSPRPRMSDVMTPDLHIQLPDTPPHTPVTASAVPQAKKPGYIVNGAGLPTPPADDDNNKTVHMLPNEFTRGTYGRSDSFIVETREEDMDTEYDSEDEDMTYSDDEYEYDSEDCDTMSMDHLSHPQNYQKTAPRIVLAPVV